MGTARKNVAASKPGLPFIATNLPTKGRVSENITRQIGMKSDGHSVVPSRQQIPTRRSARHRVPKSLEFYAPGKNSCSKSNPIPKTKPVSKASGLSMINQTSAAKIRPTKNRYVDDTDISMGNSRSKIHRVKNNNSPEEVGTNPGVNPNDLDKSVQTELARFQSEVDDIHYAFEKAFFQFKLNILDRTVEKESFQSKVFRFQQTLEPPEDHEDVDEEEIYSPDRNRIDQS